MFLAGAIPADLANVKSTFFQMTVSNLPSKTSVNKKFTKPQLIEEYLNTRYSLDHSNKTIQIMAAKIEALENEATLTAQIEKGIQRHNVELPLFLDDCRKAIVYAVNKAQKVSFDI